MSSRAVCSLCVAISGSAWAVRTAVSSAKVAVSVSAVAGKSAVYRRYRSGPRTLPYADCLLVIKLNVSNLARTD